MYRTGIGYDSHRLVAGRTCILGGVEIPFEFGPEGHSDADVLCHSIIDAVLGAAGLGDIGCHFPDTDPRWKDATSVSLLADVVRLIRAKGFEITWIDASVIAERPRLAAHFPRMLQRLEDAGIPRDRINLKAKTNEGMGWIGRGEGIASMAVCTLKANS